MSAAFQNAMFCFLLAAILLFIYHEKLKFNPPVGLKLLAWRLFYFGVISILGTVGFLAWGVGVFFGGLLGRVLIYVIFFEVAITLVGAFVNFLASSDTKS